MSEAPDYRSERSESPEGRGIAYGRSAGFWKSLPESVRTEVSRETDLTAGTIEDYPAFIRDQVTGAVVEDAELVGFWVAWHKAGGFGGLEAAGWHRATIYRKIRRFRARFGRTPMSTASSGSSSTSRGSGATSSRSSCIRSAGRTPPERSRCVLLGPPPSN